MHILVNYTTNAQKKSYTARVFLFFAHLFLWVFQWCKIIPQATCPVELVAQKSNLPL